MQLIYQINYMIPILLDLNILTYPTLQPGLPINLPTYLWGKNLSRLHLGFWILVLVRDLTK